MSEEGVYLSELPVGTTLYVRTRNTMYTIEKQDDKVGVFYRISGHPKYCPTPTIAYIQGDFLGVGTGRRIWFSTDAHPEPIITSSIQNIMEVR